MAHSKHGASSTGFVKKAAAALIALILALSVLGVNAFADDEIMTADQLASLTIAAGFDEDENTLFLSTAAVWRDGEHLYADIMMVDGYEDAYDYGVILYGTLYTGTIIAAFEDIQIVVVEIDYSPMPEMLDYFYECSAPEVGDDVNVVLLYLADTTDAENILQCKFGYDNGIVTIGERTVADGYDIYDYTVVEDLDTATSDNMMVPAFIMNDDDELLGFLGPTADIFTHITFDTEAPVVAATDDADDSDEPADNIDSGDDEAEDIPATAENPGREHVVAEKSLFDTIKIPLIVLGCIAAVAIVAVILIVVIYNNKKKTGGVGIDEYGPTQPIDQTDGTERADDEQKSVIPVLTGVGGALGGQKYRLDGDLSKNIVTIGRSSDCYIHYPEDETRVSKHHCSILMRNGGLVLVDNDSTNGTYIKKNGMYSKLTPQSAEPLKAGDKFYVGVHDNAFVLTFE